VASGVLHHQTNCKNSDEKQAQFNSVVPAEQLFLLSLLLELKEVPSLQNPNI